MKVNEVPQDNTIEYYEGVKRACYAVNDEGKYVIVPSNGWSEEEFAAREGVQESLDRKRARADVIIDNSGSPQRTQAQVEQFWASLIR